MIIVLNTENRSLFEADLTEMCRQRKIAFVDRVGWKLPVVADQEIERYDLEDTVCLPAKRELEGPLFASVPLLSTTRPHLMGDPFPVMCRDAQSRAPTVWEAPRFCASSDRPRRGIRLSLFWEIISAYMETSLLYGLLLTNSGRRISALGRPRRSTKSVSLYPQPETSPTAEVDCPDGLSHYERSIGLA
jgi:N-acyl-L-homoserine lactone synthetase